MERGGALRNPQVLKLQMCAFESTLWEVTEGEFCQVCVLLLEKLNIEKWIANEMHYPRLEHLMIWHCSKLEDIPCEIGENHYSRND